MLGEKKKIFVLLRLDQEPGGTNQCHYAEWIHSIWFTLVLSHRHAKTY